MKYEEIFRVQLGHQSDTSLQYDISQWYQGLWIEDEDSKSDSRKGVTVQVRSAVRLYSVNFSSNFFFFLIS